MRLPCFTRDRSLSRYVDGELSLAEYRQVQAHVRVCARCAARAAAFRDVNRIAGLANDLGGPAQAPAGLALSLAVAAALVASLGLNFWLPREPAPIPELAGLSVPHAPSEALAAFYERLAPPAGGR